MKRNTRIIAAIMAAAIILPACNENEINIGDNPEGSENTFSFAFKGTRTRSSASNVGNEKNATFSLGTADDGNVYYLEEYVTDLDELATRGTPAYTENVVKLYDSTLFAHSQLGDDKYRFNKSTELYSKSYGKNVWDVADPLEFYMYMPSDLAGKYGVSETLTYGKNDNGNQTIAFDYVSPATAAAQKDIIFSARSVSEEQYNTNNKVVDVLFHHALTGVKFATANYISGKAKGTKTYITQIKFKGLTDAGHCVVTPTTENNNYQDDADIYSSGQTGVVVWTEPTSGSPTGNNEDGIYQTFTSENYAQNIYSYSEYEFPDSFYADDVHFGEEGHSTADWNINDKNASLTFWLIPQTLNNVELEITFVIDAGGVTSQPITRSIKPFNQGVTWKAGELRTYVLKATEVAVNVEDNMNDAGTQKNTLQIRNTGNVPQWVRATIVAYWADEEGNAVYGYTSNERATDGSYVSDDFVAPWILENEIASKVYGEFFGLPGTGWEKGSDGYYYYTNIIGVDEAATTLFTTYTVQKTPTVYMLDRNTMTRGDATPVHLEMKIVVQAILANAEQKKVGNDYVYTATESYAEAWADARIVTTSTEGTE